MSINKREVLQATTFGERIAEEERGELSSYFVETDQWQGSLPAKSISSMEQKDLGRALYIHY